MALFSSIHLRTIAQHQFPDRKTWTSQKNNESNLTKTYARAQFLIVFDELGILRNGRTYQGDHMSQAVVGLIVFAAEQIIQSETESKDKDQLTNELERIVADGTEDNGDEDQSEHVIEPKHFTNGNDGLRKNDSGTQLQTATNENGYLNHQAIDSIGTGSLHTTHPQQELRNPNILQHKGQPPLITTPPELGQAKGKVVAHKQRMQPASNHDTRSKTGQQKSVPDKYLGTLEAGANSNSPNFFTTQLKLKKMADLAQVTEEKQKQRSTPRLTSRISWTEQEGKEERRESRDLENRETDNEDGEILDRNGIYPPKERQSEYQQAITLVKDNKIQGNRRRSKGIQGNAGGRNEREHCNTDQKRINQVIQPDINDKESKREMEKDTGCESFEQIDRRLPLQDARFERSETNNQTWRLGTSLNLSSTFHHLIVQTKSQPYLAFEFQNNHYSYRAMSFGTKHSPIYFATAMEPIIQRIRMKTEIIIIIYVDDIILLHQNKEYLKNM
ncbi:MAG: hypothetical protein EZS28_039888, partial [Streblomastix strix]